MSYVSFVKIVCNMSNCIRSNMKMKCHNDIDDYLFHSYGVLPKGRPKRGGVQKDDI